MREHSNRKRGRLKEGIIENVVVVKLKLCDLISFIAFTRTQMGTTHWVASSSIFGETLIDQTFAF